MANRVSQMQVLFSPSQWSQCAGEDNPADLLTRGVTTYELMSSKLWLQGPTGVLKDWCSRGSGVLCIGLAETGEVKEFQAIVAIDLQ